MRLAKLYRRPEHNPAIAGMQLAAAVQCAVQEATGLPVFDYLTMINYVYSAVVKKVFRLYVAVNLYVFTITQKMTKEDIMPVFDQEEYKERIEKTKKAMQAGESSFMVVAARQHELPDRVRRLEFLCAPVCAGQSRPGRPGLDRPGDGR